MRILKILLYRTIIFLLKGTVLWINPVKILQTYKTNTMNTQTRLQFVDNKQCCSSRDMIPRLANTLVSKNCFLIAFKIWWFLRSHIVKTIKSLCVMSFLCVKTKAVYVVCTPHRGLWRGGVSESHRLKPQCAVLHLR